MPSEVPSKIEPIAALDAAKLVLALGPKFMPELGREGARLILAHFWLETGKGKGAKNFNIGNLMAAHFVDGREVMMSPTEIWPGDYTRPSWFSDPTKEMHQPMLQGKQPSAFRAYPDYQLGTADYLRVIAQSPSIRQGALSGSANDFAMGIYHSGYCRDSACAPSIMSRELSKLAAHFKELGFFESLPESAHPPRAPSHHYLALAGVFGAAAYIFLGTLKTPKRSLA